MTYVALRARVELDFRAMLHIQVKRPRCARPSGKLLSCLNTPHPLRPCDAFVEHGMNFYSPKLPFWS